MSLYLSDHFRLNSLEVWVRNLLSVKNPHVIRSESRARVLGKKDATPRPTYVDPNRIKAELQRWSSTTLWLEVAKSTCAVGHRLEIEIILLDAKTPLRFTATAKVTSFEPMNEVMAAIIVQLVQFDRASWDILLQRREAFQAECTEYLMTEKGIPHGLY